MPAPVRRRSDFEALSRSRARGRSGPLRIVRAPLADHDDPTAVRIAYAVPRSVGSAVVRNRIRRRLRAMTAELVASGVVSAGLHLVSAGRGAEALPFAELRRHLAAAVDASATGSRR